MVPNLMNVSPAYGNYLETMGLLRNNRLDDWQSKHHWHLGGQRPNAGTFRL